MGRPLNDLLDASRDPRRTTDHGALRRVEDVALGEIKDIRLYAKLGHGAGEAYPVQELGLAGSLDLRERDVPPGGLVPRPKLLVTPPIRLLVGKQEMVL